MKTKLLLLFILFTNLIWSQAPVSTPEEYETQKTYWENFVKIQEGMWDVTIPAEERILYVPDMLSLATGNWGTEWHGVLRNAKVIREKSQRKVAVFVFDTGGGYSNSRLDRAWWKGMEKNFTTDLDLIDVQGHSTHVSGIIGAIDPEGLPIGIGVELVKKGLLKIIPYKVLNNQGSGAYAWIGNATKEANKVAKDLISKGWFVIYNYSLGGPSSSSLVDTQLKEAHALGVLIFASAGNTGQQGVGYPGRSIYTQAIAAAGQKGDGIARASYSTFGREVKYIGAGSLVLSTIPNNGLAKYSGTSMSCPTLAGLAAIYASTHPKATAKQVLEGLNGMVYDLDPRGIDIYSGSGSPMLDSLFQKVPDEPEDEPEDPVEEPSTQKKRTITVNFNNPYTVKWKAAQGGQFKDMTVDIAVKLETKLYSEDAIRDLYEKTDHFFQRRVFIVAMDDFLDAAYWVRYFYELLLNRQDIKVNVIKIEAEFEGLRGRPAAKNNLKHLFGKDRLINTLQYGESTSLSTLQEYNIKKGQQNFSPNESIWPIHRPKGFDLVAMLDSSCWYSQEDWTYDLDRDWYDWNKLKGVTNYFTANNRTSALIAWRPDTIPYHFQVAAYTNYPKSAWTVSEPIVVPANSLFNCSVDLQKRKVQYTMGDQSITHPFARRLWFGRRTGTWMGGANNSEGPFGGEASKDMKLWAELSIK